MNNVIDFAAAANHRKETKELIDQSKNTLLEVTKKTHEFFNSIGEPFKDEEVKPGIVIFGEIMAEFYDSAWFKGEDGEAMAKRAGMLSLGNFQEDALKFVNGFFTEETPERSLLVFGLFTTDAFAEVVPDWKPDEMFKNNYQSIDPQVVKTYFYDYQYEHPDVDTERDCYSGMLSVYGYESINGLLARGYAFADYAYSVEIKDGRKEPDPILMKFTKHGQKDVVMYYHSEAAMMIAELFLKQAHNIDV